MKIRQILLTGVTVMLLATSNAWADNNENGNRGNHGNKKHKIERARAPEINAASGTSAIALLAGALLLAGERSRSRRS